MTVPASTPLVRQAYLEKAATAISVLQVSVKNCDLIGLVSINTVSEGFFRDLLNICYKLDLINLNNGICNYPAIDLGDKSGRLCFQVSSDGTKKKIQKTLRKFADPKHGLLQWYDRIRIFVIGKRQKKYENLITPKGVRFDPTTDVIDVEMLIAELPNLATADLEAISRLIDQEMPMFRSARHVDQQSDNEVLDVYRSFFLRRALLDPWGQEGDVGAFRDAIDSLVVLLTTGYSQGEPTTKPIGSIGDGDLKRGMERVYLKLVRLRQLYTSHERLGDIDAKTNFGNFQNAAICVAFDTYKQDVIDELNKVLSTASLELLPNVMKMP